MLLLFQDVSINNILYFFLVRYTHPEAVCEVDIALQGPDKTKNKYFIICLWQVVKWQLLPDR